nr:hypothetical protein GCM10020093_027420 [Planobispora longispora]
MNVLAEWTALVCEELGVDPEKIDRDMLLDLTKEVAHGVARPAAPLTAYLLGLAQGRGRLRPTRWSGWSGWPGTGSGRPPRRWATRDGGKGFNTGR